MRIVNNRNLNINEHTIALWCNDQREQKNDDIKKNTYFHQFIYLCVSYERVRVLRRERSLAMEGLDQRHSRCHRLPPVGRHFHDDACDRWCSCVDHPCVGGRRGTWSEGEGWVQPHRHRLPALPQFGERVFYHQNYCDNNIRTYEWW